MQFLSEPRAGRTWPAWSPGPPATVTVRPERLEDLEFQRVPADYALCLARTDRHAPKHRGLTMFLVKIHQPGIDVQRIKHGQRVATSSARSSSTTWPCPRPTWWARSTTAGRWPRGSCSTSATPSAAARPTSAAAPAGAGDGRGSARSSTWPAPPAGRTTPRVRQLVAEARANDRVAATAHRTGHARDPHRRAAGAGRGHSPAFRRHQQ